MISFSCSHCGMKLKVKSEFAGRSSRCPTCKQPLVVPAPDKTQADVAAGQIDGSDSSLAKAGVDGGVTLEQAAVARPGQKPVHELLARRTKKDGRYIIEGEIARGGMGTVLRAVDCDIRREVAVKYLLDQSDAGKKARFVEEAQITGQLEHPNIVPIHELGVDALKRLFFSMKMVKGRSLAQVLDLHRTNPKTAEKEFSLGRLLNIVISICNALAYAHSRGVVHRDLKPANIMVGDFGEVYVMDWGLAKVVKGEGQMAEVPAPMASVVAGASAAGLAAVPANQTISTKRASKVETSRQPEADLTQEGAVLGTPVYMPPEQATGNLQAIDHRSDIYSLGAILYEMLTLQPPIAKEGGYLDILMRVMQGEIVAPEQRNPARAGKIPKELSAIAMKALAKHPQHRYQSVEALRQDIERFQEGRSVSAKEDTKREMIWKFVKRNRGFSAGVGVALLVLLCSTGVLSKALWETSRANAASQQAQKEKDDRTKQAIPALIGSARLLGNDGQLKEAMEQVDFALTYDGNNPEAHLLRGQLLIAQQEWVAARAELKGYLQLRPNDADAKKLVELCDPGKTHDSVVLFDLAEVFQHQKAYGLASHLFEAIARSVEARRPLLKAYQKQIEAAWQGLGRSLIVDQNGQFVLNIAYYKQVASLAPLKGMLLNRLDLQACDRIADLSPLKGMPLTTLNLSNCSQVSDLSPLKGMRLTTLNLSNCGQVTDLSPLHGMPLTSMDLGACGQVSDLSPLHGMPLTMLNLTTCGQVSDLSPLRGMPLTTLNLTNSGQVSDLSPLRGMPLTTLDLTNCGPVSDLSPLRGMRLTTLSLWNCGKVSDLSPLQGMPLTRLNFLNCPVRDLTPLQGMSLTEIWIVPKLISKGMDVLRQMKSLKIIHYGSNPGDSVPAQEFWKKYDAGEFK